MSQIVMLDNEPARIGPWLQALQKVHGPDRVELITTVAAALDRFEGAPIDVLVWDLMMPRGPLDEGATEYSTRTGEVLYRRFRERWPGAPAILLTNVLDQAVFERYSKLPLSRAARKRDLTPGALVVLVDECLGLRRGPALA